jgi:putative ABC transport system permease protein
MAEMTTGSIALNDHIGLILITLIIAIVIGIVASVYPAMFVTSFQPALAIKGSFGLTPKGRKLRTSLITLQLIVSCIMVVYLGILLLQSRFIFHSDYGFEKDEVLYAEVWDIRDMNKQDALRSELLRLTGVEEVGYSQFAIGTQDSYMGWGRGDGEHQVMFTCLPCDWRYLRTLGIKIEEGRDFNEHDQDVYIINRHMKDACDWMEIDKPILKDNGTLVGVCGNVRYASVRTDRYQTNMAFHIFSDEQVKDWHPLGMVNVRVGKNIDKVQMKQQMKAVIDRLGNGSEHEVFFLDQKLEQTYEDEFRFIRQVVLFSIVCLVITLIGLFCLTLFETEYRRKEIGIRKVFGSSTGEILTMLCRSYVWLLVGSFIVAAPLAWYIGNQWLQSFAERTPIYWWLFPVALLAVATVTLVTIIIQSWRAATENPVNSIKNE